MESPSRDVINRLPLAESVLILWRWVADHAFLAQIFDRHRGSCYERLLSFPFMVYLLRDALLEHHGSGHRTLEHAQAGGTLPASFNAVYRKLGRLPIPVSTAFLAGCTARLLEVFPQTETAQTQLPRSLAAYRVIVLDGKVIKHVAKRLKPLRGAAGGMLGGRTLVAQDLRTGLALAMHAETDGDANDTRFVGDLLPEVRDLVNGPRLWVADCGFCDLTQPIHFTADPDDAFLIRYHSKVSFHRDPDRCSREGRDSRGRQYVEEWGWLGSSKNKKRRYVRRIILNRVGEEDVILVTSLLDGEALPASDLLDLYLMRWGIERMFQQVTEVFGLSRLIGTTPNGTIFQFALCLLLYNMIEVIRAEVAAVAIPPSTEKPIAIPPRDGISTENLFDDVRRELIAWNVVIEPEVTLGDFEGEWTAVRVKARLAELLVHVWRNRWRKAPAKKKKPPAPSAKPKGVHGSVFRMMEAYREKSKQAGPAVKEDKRC